MLFRIDVASKKASEIPPTSYSSMGLMERSDLQEWILGTPEMLGEPLLVVTTEYDRFDKTAERLDLLAVDEEGKLVVVELKRNAIGTVADLQALRYAAFCSTWTLDDIVAERARHLRRLGYQATEEEARLGLLTFAPHLETDGLDSRPRIVLGAEDFSPEITATVLWLRGFGVDMSCVRLTPYKVGNDVFLDSSVIIPLPEAQDFLVLRQRKEEESARASGSKITPDQLIESLDPVQRLFAERVRSAVLAEPGVQETGWAGWISYRGADRTWRTWVAPKKSGIWVGLPPEAAPSEELEHKMTKYGWWDARVATERDLEEVLALLAKDYGVRHLALGRGPSRPADG